MRRKVSPRCCGHPGTEEFQSLPCNRKDGGSDRNRHFEQQRNWSEQRLWDSTRSQLSTVSRVGEVVLQETNNRGADLIVEVGGAGTFNQSLQAVRYGGTVAQIGVLTHQKQPLPNPLILHRQFGSRHYVGQRLISKP